MSQTCLSPEALGRQVIGEGSEDERSHLEACALCQAALAALDRRLSPPRSLPPPAAVFERLEEAIAREHIPATPPVLLDPALWRWGAQTLAAAVVLVASFVGLILIFAKDSPPAAFIYSLY